MNSIFKTNLKHFAEAVSTTTDEQLIPVQTCTEATKNALLTGNKIMLCGNGGSESTASHIINDFIGQHEKLEPERAILPLRSQQIFLF